MMLIAIEGLDQSGKETQARQLRASVEQHGHTAHALSFPDYETPIGREIAKALHGEREFGPDVMQLLYVANRLEHGPRLARWLADDAVVVCDRFRASSVAYGEAQGLDPAWLEDIQRHLPAPALTILLDISPDTAVARKSAGRDRYERDLALLGRVRESYHRQSQQPHWVFIDGEQSKAEVTAAVWTAVRPLLELRSTRGRS